MNEWTVVGVVVTLIGLVAAVARPLIKLNTTITILTETVKMLQKQIEEHNSINKESHDRLWEKEKEQDKTLADHDKTLIDHENRILYLEKI